MLSNAFLFFEISIFRSIRGNWSGGRGGHLLKTRSQNCSMCQEFWNTNWEIFHSYPFAIHNFLFIWPGAMRFSFSHSAGTKKVTKEKWFSDVDGVKEKTTAGALTGSQQEKEFKKIYWHAEKNFGINSFYHIIRGVLWKWLMSFFAFYRMHYIFKSKFPLLLHRRNSRVHTVFIATVNASANNNCWVLFIGRRQYKFHIILYFSKTNPQVRGPHNNIIFQNEF